MALKALRGADYEGVPFEFRNVLGRYGSRYCGIHKFGYNPDVGTSFEDVWRPGGTQTQLTSADNMEILSDSTDDDGDPAGTGAQTVTIYGLDSNWDLASETVTMNGTSVVTTTGTFIRVYRALVATAGTGQVNAGNITIRDATNDTTQAYIAAGEGQTLQALMTVPNGNYGILTLFDAEVGLNDTAEIEIRTSTNGGPLLVKDKVNLTAGSDVEKLYMLGGIPLVLPEKTDVIVRAKKTGAGGTTSVSAAFSLVFVDEVEYNANVTRP